jgi:hypothetical protein
MDENVSFNLEFNRVQKLLNAPKSRFNSHLRSSYRHVEDIYTGWKRIDTFLCLAVTDELVFHGDRVFIKSTAEIFDEGRNNVASGVGFAEIDKPNKGTSLEMKSGTSSSYARKYALGGLLLCDDMPDADNEKVTTPDANSGAQKPPANKPQTDWDSPENISIPFDLKLAGNDYPKRTKVKDMPKEAVGEYGANQKQYLMNLQAEGDQVKIAKVTKQLQSIAAIFNAK